jgi:hypothetical protein
MDGMARLSVQTGTRFSQPFVFHRQLAKKTRKLCSKTLTENLNASNKHFDRFGTGCRHLLARNVVWNFSDNRYIKRGAFDKRGAFGISTSTSKIMLHIS